nr:hypothetical protein [Aeromonas caviae]
MSSKIYFNTRRFSPSKLLLGLGTRLHHVLAPTHAKRTASKLLLTRIGRPGTLQPGRPGRAGHPHQ